MIEIITKFNPPSRKLFKVLISDHFKENYIFTNMIEKILEDEKNQCFCHYYGYKFYLHLDVEHIQMMLSTRLVHSKTM